MGRIQEMVDYAVRIANDDAHGYSQHRRWESQGTDFDCSSLMYTAAHRAGYSVPVDSGYTGTMVRDFTAAGFAAVPFDGNLADLDPGDIMLNVEHHTEMYIGGGRFVGAHGSETGGIDGAPGDQTGDEISVCPAYVYWAGWDYVLVPPADGVPATGGDTAQGDARGEARRVQLYPSNGTDAQKWVREWDDKTWFRLRNAACGKYLDMAGASATDGTAVQVCPGNGSKAQRWREEGRAGDSCVNIVSAVDESKCLDCEGGSTEQGTSLVLWAKHGGANQDWAIVENRDGTVTLLNNGDGRKLALDVVGGGA